MYFPLEHFPGDTCQIVTPLLCTSLSTWPGLILWFEVLSEVQSDQTPALAAAVSVSSALMKMLSQKLLSLLLALVFIFRVQCSISNKYRCLIIKVLVKEKRKTIWGVEHCSHWLKHCICKIIYCIKRCEGLWPALTADLPHSDEGSVQLLLGKVTEVREGESGACSMLHFILAERKVTYNGNTTVSKVVIIRSSQHGTILLLLWWS